MQTRFRTHAMVLTVLSVVFASCSQATDNQSDTIAPDPDDQIFFDVHGHRGARGLKPENTLPSFEMALDLGVSTLEFDLHFTADGEVTIWHDPEITREKCGLKPGAPDSIPDPDDADTDTAALAVRALTASELGWFDCSRNPDPGRFPDQSPAPTALAGDDYGIVTLNDLIDFIEMYAASDQKTSEQRTTASTVRFNMETKRTAERPETIDDGFDGVNPGLFELQILEVIDEYGIGDRAVIQSFDHRSLTAIRTVNMTVDLAMLTTVPAPPLELIAANGATIWSPIAGTATPDLIGLAHTLGLSVHPWTVNDVDEMRRLVSDGVDGIITDRPDLALALVSD